ncbi:ribose transport system permease protein [Anaerobacterium chartisolvens]|uniref:Ribose transport system permease protein n=1 Tax=Anaerobacterium chartisolvens TaxID=1297424 RepID=A0A369B4T3_9FIRM|nr:ABC transporter permease [Anaerobacterium chartisolvens]RCX16539.1 ribose transport system permease protein [Anaerobacterium chartisolvens]
MSSVTAELEMKNKRSARLFMQEWIVLFILLGLVVVCSIFVPNFFDSKNFLNIARQVSFIAIIAIGEFFVILVGNMDMSIGSVIGFVSVLMATLVKSGTSVGTAIVLVLTASVAIGLINAAVSVYGKVPSFIATLATMLGIKGINYLMSSGIPISGLPKSFNVIGMGYIGGFLPVPVMLMLVVALICWVFTNHTQTGRNVFSVGGNEEASTLSGINTKRIKTLAFVLSSVLAAVGAIALTSKTMAGLPAVGDNMLFDVMTICVLGGTSLTGGRGKVWGVVIASLILGVMDNAMVLLSINTYWQWIVKGVILASVVLIDMNSKKD